VKFEHIACLYISDLCVDQIFFRDRKRVVKFHKDDTRSGVADVGTDDPTLPADFSAGIMLEKVGLAIRLKNHYSPPKTRSYI
jgi:hypothetical protein